MTCPTRGLAAAICVAGAWIAVGCASEPRPAAVGSPRKTSEKLIATIPEPFSIFKTANYYPPQSLIVSADSRHVAYAAKTDDGWAVMLDGVAGPGFAQLFRDSFLFSPDGTRLAYHADQGQTSLMVVDGKPQTPYEICGGLSFSADSRRVGYIAKRRGRFVCVIDGQEGKEYEEITAAPLFSPDGRHVVFAAKSGAKDVLIRDDVEIAAHDFLTDSIVFSADGTRLAYVAGVGKYLPPPHDRSRLTLHPLAWAPGVDQSKRMVVIDGVAEPVYDFATRPVFSPDGKHVAYKAANGKQWFVVLDGQKQKAFDGMGQGAIVFSPDSRRLAYVAQAGKNWAVVIDGQEHVHENVINDPVFSPDSKRVAYVMREGNRWITMVDGKRGPPCPPVAATFIASVPAIQPVALAFSPDSGHVVYWASSAINAHAVYVDDTPGAARGRILGRIVFESDHRIRFLELRSNGLKSETVYEVEEEI